MDYYTWHAWASEAPIRNRTDMEGGMVSGASISGFIALRQRAVASTTISVLNWPILLISSSSSLETEKKLSSFVHAKLITCHDILFEFWYEVHILPSNLAQRMHNNFINVLHGDEDDNFVEKVVDLEVGEKD